MSPLIIPLIFSRAASHVGPWYPPYLAFNSLLGLGCMVGLWMMRKWAVLTYTGIVALNQVIFLVMGLWSLPSLLVPAIVIAIGFTHLSKIT